MDEIFQILDECHLTGEPPNETETDSVENVQRDIENLLANMRCSIGSVEYSSLNKMLAVCYLKIGNELEAICHLIESHAVILRQHILHRSVKRKMREEVLCEQQSSGLVPSYVGFIANNVNKVNSLKEKLVELPKEWYMIQITGQHKPVDICEFSEMNRMHEIHITILPTGTEQREPLCITLPKPKLQSSYDVCYEIQKLLSNNKSDLTATYANRQLYWQMRERQNKTLKAAVQALEKEWLREWRILFMADPTDKADVVKDIVEMIDKLLSDYRGSISKRSEWLLKRVALAACFLTKGEIARAIKYVLAEHTKLAHNVILSIFGKLPCIQQLKDARRGTLVLIVDEHMDYVPFESMEILSYQPVTRFPSVHIAYALFKEHESTMENGFKVIKEKDNMGTWIINPSGNLDKMGERMSAFAKCWLPKWKMICDVKPNGDAFENALINRDILIYIGHGSGIQYLPPEQIERLRVKSIVMLFGCSSLKLFKIGGRYTPYGISNQYLIASSPCVIGMLWEVTDLDTDKMTSNFISSWISSPWAEVDDNAWCTDFIMS
ncbi:separin [Ceratina calcarata]|uniref:separase n=1 Tax=Ceratina calcarata TaxID=156304 RepID=A0AAJ7SCB1_9HYME|nr:separin [Ceratina calcarata]